MVGKYERGKDAAQEAVEGTAVTVGRIATIITTAVADVTREIGDLIGRGFEMREAARLAKLDEQRSGSRADGAAARTSARAADEGESFDPAADGADAGGAAADGADADGAAAPPKPAAEDAD